MNGPVAAKVAKTDITGDEEVDEQNELNLSDFEEQVEDAKSIITDELGNDDGHGDDEDQDEDNDDDYDDEDDFDTWLVDQRKPTEEEKTKEFLELMVREDCKLMPNLEKITCAICFDECAQADGVILRDCLHTFCR